MVPTTYIVEFEGHFFGPFMTTEEAFLTTLKSSHRWRVDGNRLIIEGEAGRLLLTGAAPAGKK